MEMASMAAKCSAASPRLHPFYPLSRNQVSKAACSRYLEAPAFREARVNKKHLARGRTAFPSNDNHGRGRGLMCAAGRGARGTRGEFGGGQGAVVDGQHQHQATHDLAQCPDAAGPGIRRRQRVCGGRTALRHGSWKPLEYPLRLDNGKSGGSAVFGRGVADSCVHCCRRPGPSRARSLVSLCFAARCRPLPRRRHCLSPQRSRQKQQQQTMGGGVSRPSSAASTEDRRRSASRRRSSGGAVAKFVLSKMAKTTNFEKGELIRLKAACLLSPPLPPLLSAFSSKPPASRAARLVAAAHAMPRQPAEFRSCLGESACRLGRACHG